MRKASPEDCSRIEAEWEAGRYKEAIDIYERMDRPFWYAEQVGLYYEKNGMMGKAVKEYEMLIDVYIKGKMLPLPKGPEELFVLGVWYNKRNPVKAKQYLALYLRAEECKDDPAFCLRHKRQAQDLLRGLT